MDGRELKSGGAEAFEREKVGEGNETSGWIAVCAGGREGASVRGRIRTLVACPLSLKNNL